MKKKLKFGFQSILATSIIYFLLVALGLIMIPYAAHSRVNAIRVIKLYCRIVFFILKVFVKIKLDIIGVIPENKPAIICSKHQSFLDVLMLLYILPEPRFVMKSELNRIPIFSFYANKIGCFSVRRDNKRDALKAVIETIKKEQRENNGQLVIYPEGTRTIPGETVNYKKGIEILFTKLKRPLFLVSTNSGLVWPQKESFKYNGIASMHFIKKIEYMPKRPEIIQTIRRTIEEDSLRLYNMEKSKT